MIDDRKTTADEQKLVFETLSAGVRITQNILGHNTAYNSGAISIYNAGTRESWQACTWHPMS